MKKINLKNKSQLIFFVIGISLIFLALVILLISSFKPAKPSNPKNYDISKQTSVYINDPYRDAKKITSKKLSREHCVEDVCVKDLIIYYSKDFTNIELKIINKGSKPVSGYLKVVFAEKAMTIAYKNLTRKEVLPYTIQLGEYKISDTSDYTLRKLTDEEMSKIKK